MTLIPRYRGEDGVEGGANSPYASGGYGPSRSWQWESAELILPIKEFHRGDYSIKVYGASSSESAVTFKGDRATYELCTTCYYNVKW